MADQANLQQQVTDLTAKVNAKDTEIQDLKNQITQKDEQIAAKTTELQTLTTQKDQQIAAMTTEVQNLTNTNAQKDQQIAAMTTEVQNLTNTNVQKDQQIAAQTTELQTLTTQKDQQINDLKAEVQRVKVGFQYLNQLKEILETLDKPLQQTILEKDLGLERIEDAISKRIDEFFIVNFNGKMDELRGLCGKSKEDCEQKINGLEEIRKNLLTTLKCDEGTFSEEDITRSLQPTVAKKQAQEQLQESWNQFMKALHDLNVK